MIEAAVYSDFPLKLRDWFGKWKSILARSLRMQWRALATQTHADTQANVKLTFQHSRMKIERRMK